MATMKTTNHHGQSSSLRLFFESKIMIRTQVQCLFFFYSNDVFQKENEKYENFIPTISTSPASKQNKTSYHIIFTCIWCEWFFRFFNNIDHISLFFWFEFDLRKQEIVQGFSFVIFSNILEQQQQSRSRMDEEFGKLKNKNKQNKCLIMENCCCCSINGLMEFSIINQSIDRSNIRFSFEFLFWSNVDIERNRESWLFKHIERKKEGKRLCFCGSFFFCLTKKKCSLKQLIN